MSWPKATSTRPAASSIGRCRSCWSRSAGARADARLRDHFDRLVDRISAQEVAALAEGDGFSERPSEPASIDELLAHRLDLRHAGARRPRKPPPPSAADLGAAAHDIPIPLNDRVLTYIELFQGRLRGHIQSGMERGAQYLPMIQEVFKAEGLPLDLAYIPLIESAFKPAAQSQKRARGVWQFMRGDRRGARPRDQLVRRRALGSREVDRAPRRTT